MTGLLVSVRNAAEAEAALAGGVSLLDVKEPARGALGAAEPVAWKQVLTAAGQRVPVSAALGELFDESLPQRAARTGGLAYAKIGLAEAATDRDWSRRWADALERLPDQVQRVAVVYADWRRAQAPEPLHILAAASTLGCRAMLLDTYDKSGGNLLTHCSPHEIARLLDAARRAEMLTLVGGSLNLAALETILPLDPDFVAVRGAVCRGTRQSPVDQQLVQQLAEAVARQTCWATKEA